MAENSEKKLQKFDSIEALTDFFDENDMGEYEMPEVEFDVELKRRKHYVAVDEEIAEKISEISKREHVPSGVIVNSWLREKLLGQSEKR